MIEFQYLVHALLGCAVVTTFLYFYASRNSSLLQVARWFYATSAIMTVVISAALMILILQYRFEYTYIYGHASRNLPLNLLMATFYAGQEGSFLLWTLFLALLGVLIMRYSATGSYEAIAMGFFSLILSFLALLLVAKNPFMLIWESYPAEGIVPGTVPPDGRGLNPLLMNGWITIHPPILFMGFAAMSVSYAFAAAGLVKRDYHDWIGIALPWTLFASAILGFGIMLGGFWAYETLGWGGFWGWDPVENSSLIPWLISVALIHTMLVQRRTRQLVKTNATLAILAFVAVLYSTFLTRSGVLGDTSVHSFVDPGRFAFWILLLFMVVFIAIGLYLILSRRADINTKREDFGLMSREFMLSIGSALVLTSAIFVTVGTSWPLISEILNTPKVSVSVDFYNEVHTLLMPLILIVNTFALILSWRTSPRNKALRAIAENAGGATVLVFVLIFAGITSWTYILLGWSAWFSLICNIRSAVRIVRKKPAGLGAFVSHAGIAILIFGVIFSSGLSVTHHATLAKGQAKIVGDLSVTYSGIEPVDTHYSDREKFRFIVDIEGPGISTRVYPQVLYSDYNRREAPFMEPGIRWGFIADYYVTPKAYGTDNGLLTFRLNKNAIVGIGGQDSLMLLNFEMNELADSDSIVIGARLLLRSPELDTQIVAYTVVTSVNSQPSFRPRWLTVGDKANGIGITQIVRNNDNPAKSYAIIQVRDMNIPEPPAVDTLTLDIATKPLIGLVWVGVITMVGGFGFSIYKRWRS